MPVITLKCANIIRIFRRTDASQTCTEVGRPDVIRLTAATTMFSQHAARPKHPLTSIMSDVGSHATQPQLTLHATTCIPADDVSPLTHTHVPQAFIGLLSGSEGKLYDEEEASKPIRFKTSEGKRNTYGSHHDDFKGSTSLGAMMTHTPRLARAPCISAFVSCCSVCFLPSDCDLSRSLPAHALHVHLQFGAPPNSVIDMRSSSSPSQGCAHPISHPTLCTSSKTLTHGPTFRSSTPSR